MPPGVSVTYCGDEARHEFRLPRRRTMTTVACYGVAVLDLVFYLNDPVEAGVKQYAQRYLEVGGGTAATAAVAVARLGGDAVCVGRVGADSIGDRIIADLESAGVTARVEQVEGMASPISAVVVDGAGERTIVHYKDHRLFGSGGPPSPEDFAGSDVILVDMHSRDGSLAALDVARATGVPGVVDFDVNTAQEPGAVLDAASHVVFGLKALEELTGEVGAARALAAARAMSDAWLAVTAGADGVYWLDAATIRHLPGFEVEVVDTLGAGDVHHGAFVLALAEGADLEQALVFANAAAALKCSRIGGRAGIPTRDEVEAFLWARSGAK